MKLVPWMSIAWQELGVHELAGPACAARIAEYLADSRLAPDDEIPWCSAFAKWTMDQAGYATTGVTPMARSWLDWGATGLAMAYGTVCVFKRGDSPALGHVTFLVDILPDKRLLCLGGNQANAVSLGRYDPAMLVGARWPTRLAAQGDQ